MNWAAQAGTVTFTGMMIFRSYTPPTIQHLVKSIWYMEVQPAAGLLEEEIIPDGRHELIFYLDNSTPRTQSSAGSRGSVAVKELLHRNAAPSEP
jgi:hypothetical protein